MQMIRKDNKGEVNERSALMLLPEGGIQMLNVTHKYIEMPFGNGHGEEIGSARRAEATVVGHGDHPI
jgi:hypothetical protein